MKDKSLKKKWLKYLKANGGRSFSNFVHNFIGLPIIEKKKHINHNRVKLKRKKDK